MSVVVNSNIAYLCKTKLVSKAPLALALQLLINMRNSIQHQTHGFNTTHTHIRGTNRTDNRTPRAFSVVGPSVWNGLPLALRLFPRVHSDTFYSDLKTAIFS